MAEWGEWEFDYWHPPEAVGEGCQPSVQKRFRPHDFGTGEPCDTKYRAVCLRCSWVGPEREDDRHAVEEAHDHAFPGWRDLPVVDAEGWRWRHGSPAEHKKGHQQALKTLQAIYPPDWTARAGPIRAWRDPGATRHVPGYSPFGGYELAVIRSPEMIAERIQRERDRLLKTGEGAVCPGIDGTCHMTLETKPVWHSRHFDDVLIIRPGQPTRLVKVCHHCYLAEREAYPLACSACGRIHPYHPENTRHDYLGGTIEACTKCLKPRPGTCDRWDEECRVETPLGLIPGEDALEAGLIPIPATDCTCWVGTDQDFRERHREFLVEDHQRDRERQAEEDAQPRQMTLGLDAHAGDLEPNHEPPEMDEELELDDEPPELDPTHPDGLLPPEEIGPRPMGMLNGDHAPAAQIEPGSRLRSPDEVERPAEIQAANQAADDTVTIPWGRSGTAGPSGGFEHGDLLSLSDTSDTKAYLCGNCCHGKHSDPDPVLGSVGYVPPCQVEVGPDGGICGCREYIPSRSGPGPVPEEQLPVADPVPQLVPSTPTHPPDAVPPSKTEGHREIAVDGRDQLSAEVGRAPSGVIADTTEARGPDLNRKIHPGRRRVPLVRDWIYEGPTSARLAMHPDRGLGHIVAIAQGRATVEFDDGAGGSAQYEFEHRVKDSVSRFVSWQDPTLPPDVNIEVHGTELHVRFPLDRATNAGMKRMGGRWNQDGGYWSVPASARTWVEQALKGRFGREHGSSAREIQSWSATVGEIRTEAKAFNSGYPEAAAAIDKGEAIVQVLVKRDRFGKRFQAHATRGVRLPNGGFAWAHEPVALTDGWDRIRDPRLSAVENAKRALNARFRDAEVPVEWADPDSPRSDPSRREVDSGQRAPVDPHPPGLGDGMGPDQLESGPAESVGKVKGPMEVVVRRAEIALGGWGGVTRQVVEVVGETPQRYRIRAIERTRLAGRHRYLEPGAIGLVPRHAVRFLPGRSDDSQPGGPEGVTAWELGSTRHTRPSSFEPSGWDASI